MSALPTDRRTFLKTSALAAAGGVLHAAAGRAGEAKGKAHAVRLGGPAFAKSNEPEQIALAHKGLGYRAVARTLPRNRVGDFAGWLRGGGRVA